MISLHAAFTDRSLTVWAEPDGGPSAIVNALREAGLKRTAKDTAEAIAWLPTAGEAPAPSTALFGEEKTEGDCYLAPHVVTAMPLQAAAALDLLAFCRDRRMIAPGIHIGADLAYWVSAMPFAAGLAARGRFLPSVAREADGFRARWVPVALGADAGRMHALADAMPPAARALSFDESAEEPQNSAGTVLEGFCAFVVDEIVRSAAPPFSSSIQSSHDRWMAALSGPSAAIPDDEGAALAQAVEQWSRPVQVAARAPFRLCFRLDEPAQPDQPWSAKYLLQSSKDPSLLLPAAKVWQPGKTEKSALARDAGAAREHLLASLGRAAAVAPCVEATLASKHPDQCRFDAVGAHEFLRITAPALEAAGFGVMLPAWWTHGGTAARLKAKAIAKGPKMAAGAKLGLGTIVEFDWQLALGGAAITREELAALAKLKTPLVNLRGQWVEVDADAIREAIEFLGKKGKAKATVRELMTMSIGAAAGVGPFEVEGVEAEGWLGDLLARLEGRRQVDLLAPPAGLRAVLRPYQVRGYSWLAFLEETGLGACLADDMGLGKTLQTLALVQQRREEGETRPALLVCPTSVLGNWEREAARFTPELPVVIHHGVSRGKSSEFAKTASKQAIVLTSYALLHRDAESFAKLDWAGLILDEAQNIKNAATLQAKAARSIQAGYRIALTGTPVENNVGDLWSLMEFLNPGLLGGQTAFTKNFFRPIQIHGDAEKAALLRRITGPFILRRLKTDKSVISDLPDKIETKVFCNLTREQASLYEAVVSEARAAIEGAEGIQRKGLVLATLTKLKQVCNHPAQFLGDNSRIDGRSGKLSRLEELLEEVFRTGGRSLIFTQFTGMGEILRSYIREMLGIPLLYLHGGTPRNRREEMIQEFAQDAGPRVFVLSLKAGGTGLNLTAANHVFHFDRWWNPAVEDQATDRAFRLGQQRNVQVHKFVCSGTVEEKIDAMIDSKKDVAGRVVGAGEQWLGELSNSQLRELFALRADAIGD